MSGSHPRHVAGVTGKDLGEEFVVYEPGGDRVHVLNSTAREIFLLCDGTRPVDAIVRTVLERFEGVDEDTARADVAETIRQLESLGILTRS